MSGAVFLSYASQDAAAAKRVADSLRAAGIEVWLDAEGGLEPGDAWDAKIRRQIKECVLFIPLISANTQARLEGYFRIEWELAAERAIGIASGIAFILPVLIDETREPDALVPDRFRKVQWSRLPGGEVTAAARAQLLKLWEQRTGAVSAAPPPAPARLDLSAKAKSSRLRLLALCTVGMVLIIGAALWLRSKRAGDHLPSAEPTAAAAPAEPESEARRLAHQAAEMSVWKYNSTLDEFHTAEGLLKKARELDPNDGEVLAISAELNFMFGNRGFDYSPQRMAAARAQSEQAISLAPDSIEALYIRGVVQTRISSSVDAGVETLRKVIAKAPKHALALIYLGGILSRTGHRSEALALFERATAQPEWAALAYYFEYLVNFSEAKFPAAEVAVRRSIAADPSVNPFAALATLQMTWRGNLDDALRDLDAVPPTSRADRRIVWITTEVQLSRRKPEEALRVLDRLPDDFIHDSWFIGPKDYLVGQAQALAGRPIAARIAWEHGLAVVDEQLKAARSDPALHLSRGELLALLGRKEEAEEEARAANEIDRGQLLAWYRSVVKIYADLGRADLALPLLKALLARVAHDAEGKFVDGWPLTRTLLRQDPLWDKLRGDPGFQALLVGD